MIQRWSLATPPAEEPVTVPEARDQLRLGTITADDSWLADAIVAAREALERSADLALVTQAWDVYLDYFPRSDLLFRKGPLVTVDSVNYTPNGGSEQTVSSSLYVTDLADQRQKPRLRLALNATWPSDLLVSVNGVRIRVTAGYGDASAVPVRAKQFILQLVSHWYLHRVPVIDKAMMEIPTTLKYLRQQLSLSGIG